MYNKRDMAIEEILVPSTANKRFEKILTYGTIVCYYHWTLCGHCIAFTPLWEKVVRQYKDKVVFVKIESESMKTLPENYRVQGTPTVIIYKNRAKSKEFNGERTAENLDAFIKENVLDLPKTKRRRSKATRAK
jgi:thioredoxin 1